MLVIYYNVTVPYAIFQSFSSSTTCNTVLPVSDLTTMTNSNINNKTKNKEYIKKKGKKMLAI